MNYYIVIVYFVSLWLHPKGEVQSVINPQAFPVLKGPFSGLRKYRIGDYRIIYAVVEKDILILRIGNRKDVYKAKI